MLFECFFTLVDGYNFMWVTKHQQLRDVIVWGTGVATFSLTVEYSRSFVPFCFISWTGFSCIYWKRIAFQLSL